MTAQPPFLGNEATVSRLESKLAAGRLPHAMLFSGPEGVGKRTYALRLIAALNCNEDRVRGCGQCMSCQKISRGSHPDVSFVSVEDDASQIKIEQVRAIRDSLQLDPGEGAVRAIVIDPADRMTAAAANGLLKVLEEPTSRTFFFLITANSNELLVTIRSRCQIYHFTPLPLEAIRALGTGDELVARWSQGSVGRAQQADPELLRSNRDQMLAFLEAALTGRPEAQREFLGTRLACSREEHLELIRAGYLLVSDLIRLCIGSPEGLVNVDVTERLEDLRKASNITNLLSTARELRHMEQNLKRYVNPQLLTDAMLVSLSASTK